MLQSAFEKATKLEEGEMRVSKSCIKANKIMMNQLKIPHSRTKKMLNRKFSSSLLKYNPYPPDSKNLKTSFSKEIFHSEMARSFSKIHSCSERVPPRDLLEFLKMNASALLTSVKSSRIHFGNSSVRIVFHLITQIDDRIAIELIPSEEKYITFKRIIDFLKKKFYSKELYKLDPITLAKGNFTMFWNLIRIIRDNFKEVGRRHKQNLRIPTAVTDQIEFICSSIQGNLSPETHLIKNNADLFSSRVLKQRRLPSKSSGNLFSGTAKKLTPLAPKEPCNNKRNVRSALSINLN